MLIRKASKQDLESMISLSYKKRRNYEKAQARFWKYKEGAEEKQFSWFATLLTNEEYIILVGEKEEEIIGFLIGRLIPAPEVYDPGGLTLMIDDFCVKDSNLWNSVGKELIQHVKSIAITKNVSQILVVCGHHDEEKRKFLRNINLSIASEWYVGEIK